MPKKMDKANVLYRAKLAAFDPAQIKVHSGRAATGAIANALKDLKRDKKAGTYKDPELKIGTVGGHLFLRAKDGKTHIDDYLLAKNWTPPVAAPPRDAAYQRKVDAYVKLRVDMLEAVTAGEKQIKGMVSALEDRLERVQLLADQAKSGRMNYGEDPGAKAAEVLRDAIGVAAEAKRVFDNVVHPPFSLHRNYKVPDDINKVDVEEYGRDFYLGKARPKYGKAVEYVKLCNTTVGQIRAAAKNARNFTDHRDREAENYRSMADEIANLAEGEVRDAKTVWGLQPVEEVKRMLTEDMGKIVGLRSQERLDPADAEKLTQSYLGNASGRVVTMKNGYTRLKKHLTKMDQIAARAKSIPKTHVKDAEVKRNLQRLATAQKALATYSKGVDRNVKAAMSVFGALKKEAAAA